MCSDSWRRTLKRRCPWWLRPCALYQCFFLKQILLSCMKRGWGEGGSNQKAQSSWWMSLWRMSVGVNINESWLCGCWECAANVCSDWFHRLWARPLPSGTAIASILSTCIRCLAAGLLNVSPLPDGHFRMLNYSMGVYGQLKRQASGLLEKFGLKWVFVKEIFSFHTKVVCTRRGRQNEEGCFCMISRCVTKSRTDGAARKMWLFVRSCYCFVTHKMSRMAFCNSP